MAKTRVDEGYLAPAAGGGLRAVLEGPVVQLLARLALAGIFFYAALPKIGDPAAFARDIANFRLLPGSLVHAAAVTLPWVELVAAVLLVVGVWTRAAALVLGGLLALFTGALSFAVMRGLDIECGCFGQSDGSASGGGIGWGTVARDGAFLVPAIVVLVWDRGRYGLEALVRREVDLRR